jgi:hypothetical protein
MVSFPAWMGRIFVTNLQIFFLNYWCELLMTWYVWWSLGNVLAGAGIAFGGFAVGIGMVTFAEAQGERSKERGGGLSESMTTQITGMLMEDVEVSSVEDLGSLTSQLEQALRASGGTKEDEFEMTEEEIKRLEEEADDGW